MSARTGNGKGASVPLGFGGLNASVRDYIGHFYQTRDEWKALLIPSSCACQAGSRNNCSAFLTSVE